MLSRQNLLEIPGPAGVLETLCILPKNGGSVTGFAVLNHPNPLHGGTNTNKVIQTAARVLRDAGFACYLPNLRGVGNSAGEHDYGRGETADTAAVWAYAQAQHGGARENVLGGFSFGGYVAAHAAHNLHPQKLLLIAPAAGKYSPDMPPVPDTGSTLLIHGQNDEIVPPENVFAWAAPQELPVVMLADAGHFFHGRLTVLADAVRRFLPAGAAA